MTPHVRLWVVRSSVGWSVGLKLTGVTLPSSKHFIYWINLCDGARPGLFLAEATAVAVLVLPQVVHTALPKENTEI